MSRKTIVLICCCTLALLSAFCFLNIGQQQNRPLIATLKNADLLTNVFRDKKFSSMLEMECKFPIIEPFEQNIKGFVHKFRGINCISQMPNLASLDFDSHKLTIHNELEPYRQSRVSKFRCFYQGIDGGLAPSTSNFNWVGEEINIAEDDETEIPFDQFVVRCRNSTQGTYNNASVFTNHSIIYERAFAGFANPAAKQVSAIPSHSEHPSLAILVLDSVSRTQFLRHMPRTLELMKKLGFIWLNGYTKVGDNSAVNLLPILAGKSILPKVGESDGSELLPENTIVDLEKTEFLWNIMKKKNCVTMLNDDIVSLQRGLFHYPRTTFTGFKQVPTDYYFRAYHLFNPKHMFYPVAGGQCMKTGQVTSEEYLDIWEKFSTRFKDQCHFSFNFLTELTHDHPSNLGAIDNRLRTSLERLLANNVLDRTALVIMGDHGNRISSIQRTYVGRIEERTPFFALYLPEEFKAKNADIIKNLEYNTNRLTSNFDVYQTLRYLTSLGLDNRLRKQGPTRGINLLTKQVSPARTCSQAGIPANFCLCMESKNISRFDKASKEFQAIRKLLEDYLEDFKCLKKGKIEILENRLQPLTINQMVRHGLRNATEWVSIKNVQAAMEIFFFDVNANLYLSKQSSKKNSKKIEKLKMTARIKHYLKESQFYIASTPIVYVYQNDSKIVPIKLSEICE